MGIARTALRTPRRANKSIDHENGTSRPKTNIPYQQNEEEEEEEEEEEQEEDTSTLTRPPKPVSSGSVVHKGLS